jgi:hypothetical protein
MAKGVSPDGSHQVRRQVSFVWREHGIDPIIAQIKLLYRWEIE